MVAVHSMVPVSKGHSDVVDILLEAGADVHQATTKDGFSPIYVACYEGHSEVVDILLKAGADVHQATTE
ncbi:Ankyrin repeat domain-containing protein 50, partial [Geodia barretti]